MQKLFYVLSVSLYLFPFIAVGQSGALDSTFGVNGIVSTDLGGSVPDLLFSMVIQPDQKILAGGISNGDFGVVRYLPDGTPDPEFGDNGIVKVDFGATGEYCRGMALQSDGRIVLAGETHINNLGDFALARLNTDGSLDTTFGVGGKVVTDLGTSYEYANAVAVQADGKIIAAGKIVNGDIANANFAMVRYDEDGEVDTDFGNNGIANSSVRDEDEATGIIIMPDGKIVLGGFAAVTAKGDYAMVRFLEDGTEDKSFGVGGKVVTDLEGVGHSDLQTCMLLDNDGKILLGGAANYNFFEGVSYMGVVRYDSEGSLDPSFGTGGIYILQLGSISEVAAMAQQPDGKYLLAGRSNGVNITNQWILARIKNEGGLDSIFGNNGIVATNVSGSQNEEAWEIQLQNDSKIVLGGVPGDFQNSDFTLARYIADFIMEAHVVSGITCPGSMDAALSVSVEGGSAPYKYSINGAPFQSSNLFTGLPPGDYIITVCDASGVIGEIGPIHIDDAPPSPVVQVEVTENTITITVDGPGPYLYSIDGGATLQASNTFPGLADGAYPVAVVDQNGCLIYNDIAFVQATGLELIHDFSFSISPNPCKDFITIEVDHHIATLKAIIVDMSGRLISSDEVKLDRSGKFTLNINQLTNGQYSLWLNDGGKWRNTSFVVMR
jgi:uncharacterized delta-60 repeat protein